MTCTCPTQPVKKHRLNALLWRAQELFLVFSATSHKQSAPANKTGFAVWYYSCLMSNRRNIKIAEKTLAARKDFSVSESASVLLDPTEERVNKMEFQSLGGMLSAASLQTGDSRVLLAGFCSQDNKDRNIFFLAQVMSGFYGFPEQAKKAERSLNRALAALLEALKPK